MDVYAYNDLELAKENEIFFFFRKIKSKPHRSLEPMITKMNIARTAHPYEKVSFVDHKNYVPNRTQR